MKILRQKDSEIHLLRMNVTDKDVQLGKVCMYVCVCVRVFVTRMYSWERFVCAFVTRMCS